MAIRIRIYPQPGSVGMRRRRQVQVQRQQLRVQQHQLMRQQELLRQQQLRFNLGGYGMGSYGVPAGLGSAYGSALACNTGYGAAASPFGYSTGFGMGLGSSPVVQSPWLGSYGYGASYANPYVGSSLLAPFASTSYSSSYAYGS